MNNQIKIQHLLWRAGFGATVEDLKKYQNKSVQQIVGNLLEDSKNYENLTITDDAPISMKDLASKSKAEKKEMIKESKKLNRALNIQWIDRMITSKAQLREKMTLFWHGHFACQSKFIYHTQKQINTLRKFALGNFGDLVLEIAKDPAMLGFLNNQQNRKQKPNENFARELMELFTLGRGNYSEKDIKESARAFTGWSFEGDTFKFRPFFHDEDEKTFMGKKGNFNGDDIIKMILEKPETAKFITTKIYKFFVNDQPNTKIIENLAQKFYQSNYNIEKLMQEIFTSEWFYDTQNIGSHIKSPIELLVGLQRQLNFKFLGDESALFLQKVLGQILLYPPNVAGWAGGKAWIDSSTLLFRLKFPENLYKISEISISAKDEEDVQKADLVNQKLIKFSATFDWKPLEMQFNSSNKATLVQNLSNFLLQVSSPALQKYALEVANTANATDMLKEITIALAGTPEYQVS